MPNHSSPNIVVIMTDQQRADLVGREGYPLDTMPFCDQLAQQGQWFDHAYTTIPACQPARVSMMTGRFPSATRIRCNQHAHSHCVAESDLVSCLRAAGYRTCLSGKNHSHLPHSHFDQTAGGFGHSNSPAKTDAEKAFDAHLKTSKNHLVTQPTPFPLALQYPVRIVDYACEWVDQPSDQPFFLWLSFPEPHNPYQVPEPYYDLFAPDQLPPCRSTVDALADRPFPWRWCRQAFEAAFPDFAATFERARSNYHGMLRLIDDQIRRFVEHLEHRGLRDDTLVIVTSDHGDFVGEYGLLRKGPGLPELLTRIPFIVTGPGIRSRNAANPAHISLADVLPTLCNLADTPVPLGVQGRDLTALWRGQDDPARYRSMIVESGYGGAAHDGTEPFDPQDDGFKPSPDGQQWGSYDCLNSRTQSGTRRALRCGDWKIVVDNNGSNALYNLSTDPAELDNRWNDPTCRTVRGDLHEQLVQWMLRLDDPLPLPDRRYQYKPMTQEVCP